MAENFGEPYDIDVPLRTTWRDQAIFQDADGMPVPIGHLKARGNLREVIGYDDFGNSIFGPVVLHISTDNGYIEIPNDNSGVMNIIVPANIIGQLSPDNTRLQVSYDIEFYDEDVDPVLVQPALAGTVTFTQRVGATP